MVQDFKRISSGRVASIQQPPQSLDYEEAILGGVLLGPDAIAQVFDILKPEAFYFKAHQEIYRVMTALHLESLPVNLNTVAERLKRINKLDEVGGKTRLISLFDSTVGTCGLDLYAQEVMDKFTRRELFKAGQEICMLAYDESVSLEDAANEAELRMMQSLGVSKRSGLTDASDDFVQVFNDIEARSAGLLPAGIPCGFYDLDAMTQGFQRSDLIIVAARPSMGKTSFVLNISHGITTASQLPVAFFSLETAKEQLRHRQLASHARVESGRLRAGRLTPDEWSRVSESIAYLSSCHLLVDDTPAITVAEIRSKCRKVKRERGDLGAIVIDYLQLMGGGGDNRVQELSRITRALKGLARELDVPVFALSQLSRGVESRTNKRPMMSDLRESGSIEQDADLVMMLYRDEYYNPDTPDRGVAEVIIAKHRNGPTGTAKLLFESQFTQFKNMRRNA